MKKGIIPAAGVAVVGLLALAGCKASPNVAVDQVQSSCVTGQSYVMELNDDDPTAFGAGTVVRTGGCEGDEHTQNYYWSSIRVQAEKWDEVIGLCGRTPRKTGYSTNVRVGQSDYCRSGAVSSRIYVFSTNEAFRNGTRYVRTPFTPVVTSK